MHDIHPGLQLNYSSVLSCASYQMDKIMHLVFLLTNISREVGHVHSVKKAFPLKYSRTNINNNTWILWQPLTDPPKWWTRDSSWNETIIHQYVESQCLVRQYLVYPADKAATATEVLNYRVPLPGNHSTDVGSIPFKSMIKAFSNWKDLQFLICLLVSKYPECPK